MPVSTSVALYGIMIWLAAIASTDVLCWSELGLLGCLLVSLPFFCTLTSGLMSGQPSDTACKSKQ